MAFVDDNEGWASKPVERLGAHSAVHRLNGSHCYQWHRRRMLGIGASAPKAQNGEFRILASAIHPNLTERLYGLLTEFVGLSDPQDRPVLPVRAQSQFDCRFYGDPGLPPSCWQTDDCPIAGRRIVQNRAETREHLLLVVMELWEPDRTTDRFHRRPFSRSRRDIVSGEPDARNELGRLRGGPPIGRSEP